MTKITVVAKVLVAALKAASLAASEDSTRPHLSALRLMSVPGRLRVDATDGHRLVTIHVAAEVEGALDALVPLGFATDVRAMLGATKPPKPFVPRFRLRGQPKPEAPPHLVTLTLDAGKLRATSGEWSVARVMVDEMPPPYEKIVPKKPEMGSSVCALSAFNPAYLADAANATRILSDAHGRHPFDCPMSFYSAAGALEPTLIEASGVGWTIRHVIMPVRIADPLQALRAVIAAPVVKDHAPAPQATQEILPTKRAVTKPKTRKPRKAA